MRPNVFTPRENLSVPIFVPQSLEYPATIVANALVDVLPEAIVRPALLLCPSAGIVPARE